MISSTESQPCTCPICYESKPRSSFHSLPSCQHSFCSPCLSLYLHFQIDTSSLALSCPSCSTPLPSTFLPSILSADYLQKHSKYTHREILLNNPYVRFCPQPNCEGFSTGSLRSPKLTCNKCLHKFCFFCSENWHQGIKCQKNEDEEFEQWVQTNNIKFCPRCKRRVQRSGGCGNMECVCTHVWCWRCGKSPQTPWHELRCLIGNDIWDLKIWSIMFLILVPLVIWFIPAVLIFVTIGVMGEPEQGYWMLRQKKCFYGLLILLSPFIEIFGIFIFVLVIGYLFFEKGEKMNWGQKSLFLLAGLSVGLFISLVTVISVLIGSLVCMICGMGLLILRISGKNLRRNLEIESFYPQTLL